MTTVSLEFLDTGACRASEHHLVRGGARRAVRCHALVGLIRHPERGVILWDTGYAPRVIEATNHFPYRLYRLVTPLLLDGAQDARTQLAGRSIAAEAVGTVIISHFHADHVAGLLDFPAATVVTAAGAWPDARRRRGFSALRRGVLPSLLPRDLSRRIRTAVRFDGAPIPGIGPTLDLFGDGSVRLARLPGHARGQLGALLNTTDGPVLLAADACWHRRSIRERRPPHPIADLVADDPRLVKATIGALADLHEAWPTLRIVPTHCPESYHELFGRSAYLE
ncbi:MAG: MBL fold metallo-hydrolase [Dehalococcoidia bacterium]